MGLCGKTPGLKRKKERWERKGREGREKGKNEGMKEREERKEGGMEGGKEREGRCRTVYSLLIFI